MHLLLIISIKLDAPAESMNIVRADINSEFLTSICLKGCRLHWTNQNVYSSKMENAIFLCRRIWGYSKKSCILKSICPTTASPMEYLAGYGFTNGISGRVRLHQWNIWQGTASPIKFMPDRSPGLWSRYNIKREKPPLPHVLSMRFHFQASSPNNGTRQTQPSK